MTDNQVTVALEKFRPDLPVDTLGNISANGVKLKPKLEAAKEDCMDELMSIKLKSKVVAILLSVFLGGWGAGRFYVGDTKIGILRLLASVATGLASLVPVLGIIVAIASLVWMIAEIFLVANRVKYANFDIVSTYLGYHRADV